MSIFLLYAMTGFAQAETEPNDSLSIANPASLNNPISGSICSFTSGSQDWFRIVIPSDGLLTVRSSVSSPTVNPPQNFSITLVSKHKNYYNSFSAHVGSNGSAALDSFNWCCLAADTFYIYANNSWGSSNICYNYSFTCTLTPATFINDAEPNSHPSAPLALAYNTNTEGHLGYRTEPLTYGPDANDYYKIVTPADGVIRVITQTEAQSPGNSTMNVDLYDKNHNPLFTQYATAGSFHNPHTDTLYWSCITKDTMHIETSISNANNGGYAYRMKYDVIQPVFGNDAEPNNSYAAPQNVSPGTTVDGHLYYFNAGDDDYYKFYKADTGYLKIYIQAETWGATNNNNYNFKLETKNQGSLVTHYPLIGGHSQPIADSIIIPSLGPDSFYVLVQHAVFNSPCMSYRLKIVTPTSSNPATGISGVSSAGLSVYPNPSNGHFVVAVDKRMGNAAVQVYSVYGQKVYSGATDADGRADLDLVGVSPGVYFLEVFNEKERLSRRVVVK